MVASEVHAGIDVLGDLLVRKLARRLVDVDLLDQATALLKYQVENRLDGIAKAQVATAASNNPVLSTLVTAVTAAKLGDTLNNAKDITVFAPTNDAFACRFYRH